MDLSIEEMGPTEGTVLALLDFLVDPLLPSKSCSSRETPSSSKEQLVAKQVHAVVLLYNYYHRKRYQGLEFLDFESFCKMAMALKPSLLSYLRLMETADHTQLNGSDKDHSLTEKAIMNACEICKTLDLLKNNPSMDGWPITGVAVFLVDDKKENCYLFHSSITQGVWSVIEKDVDAPIQISEAVIHSRSGDKKRLIKRTQKENLTANETSLRQYAYAAVKEACGINLQSDLKILENHVVYSISKKKEAVRLYIMQCTLTQQETNLVPVNDAMESLQGPLVTMESISWIATPVVEYFHLLPFADKVLDWLSREGLLSVSLNSEVQKEAKVCSSSQVNLQPNISNTCEAINDVEDHNTQIEKEPLVNISQTVEVAIEAEHNSSTIPSNHSESINGVEDCKSPIKEEPLVNISHPVEEAIKVENNDSTNPSNHSAAINGVEYHKSQIKEELLTNVDIPQPIEVAMEVEHNDSSNSSNHFETVNVGEDHNSELNENPLALMNIPQPVEVAMEVEHNGISSPSNHFETMNVVEDHNSQLNEEPLALVNIPQPVEVAMQMEHKDSSDLKEDEFENTPQPLSVDKEIKYGRCSLNTETTLEVEENNSSLLIEGPLIETSQPSVVENGVRNGNCQLKEQQVLYSSPHSATTKEVDIISRRKEKPSETMVYTKRKRLQTNSISNKSAGSKKSKAATEISGKQNTVTVLSNNTDVNEAVVTCLQTNGKNKSIPCENHGDDKKQLVFAETEPIAMTKTAIVAVEENDCLPISYEHNAEMVVSDNEISACAISNPDEKPADALVSFDSNQVPLQKIQLTIASKDTLLKETALKVLFKKRERLSHQLRIAADDIALCDRNIQTILNGGENDLDVKLDAVLEACNSECLRIAHETEDNTNLQIINLDLPLVKKRKILSEASLCVYCPCQELDGLCNANCWTLPTYNVSPSEGGFQASVMMKGPDFECSSEGKPCLTPLQARKLAASELLVKLRNMAVAKSQI